MREVKDGLAHGINLGLEFPDFTVISGGARTDPVRPAPIAATSRRRAGGKRASPAVA